jgi:hypothetical protein
MPKKDRGRAAWTKNLGTLITASREVRAFCDTCRAPFVVVDLVKLAAIKGEDYSLWNRRTKCRLTEGCPGWNRFYCDGRGMMEKMRD